MRISFLGIEEKKMVDRIEDGYLAKITDAEQGQIFRVSHGVHRPCRVGIRVEYQEGDCLGMRRVGERVYLYRKDASGHWILEETQTVVSED